MPATVGFIGLGAVGGPIVLNLKAFERLAGVRVGGGE